jgi:hypothetical protein
MKLRARIMKAAFCISYLFFAAVFIKYIPSILPTMSTSEASNVFKQYILDPIPKSVTNIRADQPKKLLGYRYTLRFDINRTDLTLLIDSKSLKRVWNVKYKKGRLDWAWDTWNGWTLNGVTITVYDSGYCRYEPLWFNPQRWDHPEAYALYETKKSRINTRVLLYNEKKGEAYYIVGRSK